MSNDVKASPVQELVRRLRQHALPDQHDEREVLHAPLLTEAADAIERQKRRADWFEQRCNKLQMAQQHMRDPERKMVCDILANGETYVTPNAKLTSGPVRLSDGLGVNGGTMINWLKKFFRVHAHDWTEPLIVSGHGYTEYEIRFCKSSKCLKCEGKLTKQLW